MIKYFLFLFIFATVSFSDIAQAISSTNRFYLHGRAEQGNILYGRTTPGSTVVVGDKKVLLSSKGEFIFGIPRDAKGTLDITATFPDGTKNTRPLFVKAKKWPVQKLNNLPKNQVNPSEEELKLIKAQASEVKAARNLNTRPTTFPGCFVQPVQGTVSSIFGGQRVLNGEPKSPHSGLDIAANTGAKIKASAPGTVSYVSQDNFYNGKMVIIDHGYGISTSYSHMSNINVKKGQKIKKGDLIGLVGSTGRSTGPHLHWGVTWLNTPLNPQNVLSVTSRRCSSGKQKRVVKNY